MELAMERTEARLMGSAVVKVKAKSKVRAMAKGRVKVKVMDRQGVELFAAPADFVANASSKEGWAARSASAAVDSSPHQDLERILLEPPSLTR
jgi:hypothetical protein